MRLLYVLDEFADRTAGTEGQFLELVQGVRARDVDVSVALLRPAPALARALPDVPATVLGLTRLRSPTTLRALWRLARWARARGAEVAHVFFNDASIACPLPLRLAGVPVIVSRRDLGFWYTPALLHLLRLNRHAVSAVVTNAQAVRQQVIAKEHYADNKVVTIYNAWPHRPVAESGSDVRRELGIPPTARLLLVVANLRALKRVDDAIRILALTSVHIPDVWLCVVGEDRASRGGDSELARLQSLAGELGVAARVVFAGARDDPWPIVNACDVGVLCSESEGLSNSLVEYSAAAKPVVCSNAGGNAEVVADTLSGYVFPTGDVQYAARRVMELLTDAGLAARLGANGRRRVHEQFGLQRMIEEHLGLYRGLVGARAA